MQRFGTRAMPTIAALAAGAALGLPAVAGAGPRADYRQMFSTPVPGASAGSDTQILYKHPDDPDAKPIAVRREVFTFPEGTEFDPGVVPVCDASELELQLQGEAACPPESRVGGGEGTFMTGFGGESAMEVDAFNDGSSSLILGGSKDPEIRFATRSRRRGRVITVDIPRTLGGPPDGEAPIRKVHNVFDAFSLGNRAYLRTPRVCPARGVWRFHARLTFADGAVDENTYDMPCNRDVTAPRIRVTGVPRRRCAARAFRVRVRVSDSSVLAEVVLLSTAAGFGGPREPALRAIIRTGRLPAGRHRVTVVARDAARIARAVSCVSSAAATLRAWRRSPLDASPRIAEGRPLSREGSWVEFVGYGARRRQCSLHCLRSSSLWRAARPLPASS